LQLTYLDVVCAVLSCGTRRSSQRHSYPSILNITISLHLCGSLTHMYVLLLPLSPCVSLVPAAHWKPCVCPPCLRPCWRCRSCLGPCLEAIFFIVSDLVAPKGTMPWNGALQAASLHIRWMCHCPVRLQGFKKVDPDRWEFSNNNFQRDRSDLLRGIQRRKGQAQHTSNALVAPGQSAIEVRLEVAHPAATRKLELLGDANFARWLLFGRKYCSAFWRSCIQAWQQFTYS
jgi:hypothetical protein